MERATLTCHWVFWGAQLLSQLLHVVRMYLLIEGAPEPLWLGLIQHRGDRVGHVNHSARLSCHYKQKPVSRFKDEMLQFLGREDHNEDLTWTNPGQVNRLISNLQFSFRSSLWYTNAFRNFFFFSGKWALKVHKADFPGGMEDKNLPANAGDTGSIPGPGRFHVPRSN